MKQLEKLVPDFPDQKTDALFDGDDLSCQRRDDPMPDLLCVLVDVERRRVGGGDLLCLVS